MNGERSTLSLTAPQEDYLKQIFLLGEHGASVATQSLAVRLGVRPASVTGMVQRLAELGLVDHRRYRGVTLTESGRQVALEMLRHHRLLETYLAESLGFGWAEIHDEADRLEHVISERFEERIAEVLGHPTRDPHGDPIPDAALRMPDEGGGRRLSERGAAGAATVLRVGSQDPDSLVALERLGLVPGASIEVLGQSPRGVRVVVGGARLLVPSVLAAEVWVEGGQP